MNTHGRGRFVAVVAAVAAISTAGGTDALASAGCTAANSGSLNADLSAGASVTRELALDAGDTLGITASGASATLVSGAGAPLTLIAGGVDRGQPARAASRHFRAAVCRRSRWPRDDPHLLHLGAVRGRRCGLSRAPQRPREGAGA